MASQIEVSSTANIHGSVVFGPNCENVKIGHATQIRAGTYIDVKQLIIGDYVTVSPGVVIHGQRVEIGHNCWIGHYSILDGLGGFLSMGNNVGVGAHSQLWTHMKFGDRLEGCRWNQASELIIEDDVWFVGHCLVTPIIARKKSMLMLGGLITTDMEENQVYAGSPARKLTHVFGEQFTEKTYEEKKLDFEVYLKEFQNLGNDISDFLIAEPEVLSQFNSGVTIFDLRSRTYVPTYSENETDFLRFLLYDRAKFLPSLPPAS